MSIVWMLIPVSLILVGCGVWAFFWAVRTGQFDELDQPGWEILVDETERGPARRDPADRGPADRGPADRGPADRP